MGFETLVEMETQIFDRKKTLRFGIIRFCIQSCSLRFCCIFVLRLKYLSFPVEPARGQSFFVDSRWEGYYWEKIGTYLKKSNKYRVLEYKNNSFNIITFIKNIFVNNFFIKSFSSQPECGHFEILINVR